MEQEGRLRKREEIPERDKWRIQDLYTDESVWEEDCKKLQQTMEQMEAFQGRSSDGADVFLQILRTMEAMNLKTEKIYVYANQRYHEDTRNTKFQEMAAKAQMLASKAAEAASYLEPEIMELSEECLKQYMQENKALEHYERFISEIRRTKEHILSKELEEVLAKATEVARGPENIFSMFNNADIKFGTLTGEDGKESEITHGRYQQFLECKERRVRKEAFEKVYEAYDNYKNTLAAVFSANVTQEAFFSSVRKYPSSLAAALDGGNIPVSVYENLIEGVHSRLPVLHRYIALRKRTLHVEELHMYDLYVPIAEKEDVKYTFEQAKEIVAEGLKPLGPEYGEILQKGFQEGWIDVYENQGKRSGAYSWGAYGTHPYVLMNYNGSLNHVFTLAHEMGHALHSYFSDREQSFLYAGYRIFVAEVASTCNEAILIHSLLEKAKDKKEKIYLINYFLEQFRATVFRQTMFAEFEKIVHEKAAQGESLTAENLCRSYYELNRKYYGEEICVDEQIAMEWARIPHFYTPFYVYQYATGFSAAIAISQKILKGEPGILEKYKKFLSGGSSMDCIDLLKICQVDMTDTMPVMSALDLFEEYLQQLEELL